MTKYDRARVWDLEKQKLCDRFLSGSGCSLPSDSTDDLLAATVTPVSGSSSSTTSGSSSDSGNGSPRNAEEASSSSSTPSNGTGSPRPGDSRRKFFQKKLCSTNSSGLTQQDHFLQTQLVASWLRVEFFFRLCECCLSFRADERVEASELRRWLEVGVANHWGAASKALSDEHQNLTGATLDEASSDSPSSADTSPTYATNVDDRSVVSAGEKIGSSLFKDLWAKRSPGDVVSTSAARSGPQDESSTEMLNRPPPPCCNLRCFGFTIVIAASAALAGYIGFGGTPPGVVHPPKVGPRVVPPGGGGGGGDGPGPGPLDVLLPDESGGGGVAPGPAAAIAPGGRAPVLFFPTLDGGFRHAEASSNEQNETTTTVRCRSSMVTGPQTQLWTSLPENLRVEEQLVVRSARRAATQEHITNRSGQKYNTQNAFAFIAYDTDPKHADTDPKHADTEVMPIPIQSTPRFATAVSEFVLEKVNGLARSTGHFDSEFEVEAERQEAAQLDPQVEHALPW